MEDTLSPNTLRETSLDDDGDVSLLEVASVVIRWRRTIITFAALAGLLGLTLGLASTRTYRSSATFIPQSSETANTGLLSAASQLGIRLPTTSAVWGPPIYVAVLRSRALLEPIVLDTLVVAEQGNTRVPVLELLNLDANVKRERALRALGELVTIRELKTLGAVEIAASTPWPSVSYALVDKLVRGLNQFNLETRKSQAAAERRFVEERAEEAQAALRAAEDRLEVFLERNRVLSIPQLSLQRDRLARDVQLRQQLYTALMQSREEARIREVRDTPVITLLETPVRATMGEARNSVLKAVLGAIAGALVGIVIAFIGQALSDSRSRPDPKSEEFFRLLYESTPRFLRRQLRS